MTNTSKMTIQKVINTSTKSAAGSKLKQLLIEYNEFQSRLNGVSREDLNHLTQWQTERLKQTHIDLYESEKYQTGLNFLLSDLYSAKDFTQRDRDIERIFPKLVKMLPEHILEILVLLIELNLKTQKLDYLLALKLKELDLGKELSHTTYCVAYHSCNNYEERRKQLMLTDEIARKLDKYVRSKFLHFALKITQKPAQSAGLEAIHDFILRGFEAFHSMDSVNEMMQIVTSRESRIILNIENNISDPFNTDIF